MNPVNFENRENSSVKEKRTWGMVPLASFSRAKVAWGESHSLGEASQQSDEPRSFLK